MARGTSFARAPRGLLMVVAAVAATGDLEEDEGALLQVNLLQHSLSLSRQPVGLATPAALSATEASIEQAQEVAQRARAVPAVVINLDLPPEERWQEFYKAQRDAWLPMFLGTRLPEGPQLNFLRAITYTEEDQELLAEVRGIVKALDHPNVTVESLLGGEFAYERGFTIGCTGVLATTANGTVYHGRNLDLRGGADFIPFLIDATFVRGGKPLILATMFAGTVGISTGYRVGGWSVAQNTRQGCTDLEKNAAAARLGARPFEFLLRHLLQDVPDFPTAVRAMSEASLIAPQYFTVAGVRPHEGALISRDRHGTEEPHGNVLVLSPQIGRWFIVQTNDDVWEAPDDGRRPAAIETLRHMKPELIDEDTVLKVMMTVPVLNKDTVFTWICQPSNGQRRMLLGRDEMQTVLAKSAPSQ